MVKEVTLLDVFTKYRKTQLFGMSEITRSVIEWYKRKYPEKWAQGFRPYPAGGHTGIDYGMNWQPVYAAHGGFVVQDDDIDQSAKGVHAVIVDPKQLIATHYYHLENNCVKLQQEVLPGQFIGWSGNTGLSDGAHLHFGLCYVDGVHWTRLNMDNGTNGFIDPLGKNVKWVDKWPGN